MASPLLHLIIASCLVSVGLYHQQLWAQRAPALISAKSLYKTERVARTHFSAHQVKWDHQNATLSAAGEVQLAQGFLKISCARATVTFMPKIAEVGTVENDSEISGETGMQDALADAQLDKVIADGGVTVTFRDLKISAAQVTYNHPSRMLTAQGVIKGTWRAMSFRGASLKISLSEQRASILETSVSLPLPRIIPSAPTEARVRSWMKR